MIVAIPKETHPGETRTPIIPASIEKLKKLSIEVVVESGVGATINVPDEAYERAGARVESVRTSLLAGADIVMRIRKPPIEEIVHLKKGALHISFLDPFNEPKLIDALRDAGVTALSMEMIPRTTLAQKMDALSSQASLGGYVAVILAAERLNKVLPMMTTPAGTIAASRVFVIGVGVAGLQAIATARRLGARVEAFDTRPVVEEQVKSLGARFVKIDLGETGQTEQGYAKALTDEQLALQRQGMAKVCAASDIVITTAQLFGRKAPLIVTDEMIRGMAAGSVIVDMAVESGGNVEGSRVDEEVMVGGVRIIGVSNLPGRVPVHASQMYSSNLTALLTHFWDKDGGRFNLNLEDEILRSSVITHDHDIINERIRELRS